MLLLLLLILIILAILVAIYCSTTNTVDHYVTAIAQPYLSDLEYATAQVFRELQVVDDAIHNTDIPLYVVHKDKIELYIQGKLSKTMKRSNNLYSDLYSKGMRVLIGFITSQGLKEAVSNTRDDVSIISLGSASSRLENIPRVVRLNASYRYWFYPKSQFTRLLQGESPLVVYDNTDEASSDFAELVKQYDPNSKLVSATSNLAQIVEQEVGARQKVILLTFDLSEIAVSTYPKYNSSNDVITYINSDTLPELDIIGFPHDLTGFGMYTKYPHYLTRITWNRVVYITYIYYAFGIASYLRAFEVMPKSIPSEVQTQYTLDSSNDRMPISFIPRNWHPNSDLTGGTWVEGIEVNPELSDVVEWSTHIEGSLTSGVTMTMGSAALRLCYLFRAQYWSSGEFNQEVTESSLRALPLANSDSNDQLIQKVLDSDNIDLVFKDEIGPHLFTQSTILS